MPDGAAKIQLRAEALEMLLSGIDLKGARMRPWYEDPSVFPPPPPPPPPQQQQQQQQQQAGAPA